MTERQPNGLPAPTLRVLVLAFAFVAVFSACWVGAFHSPSPHRIPVGVVAPLRLDSGPTLTVTTYDNRADLERAVLTGRIVGGVAPDGATAAVVVAQSAGASAVRVAERALSEAAANAGRQVAVRTIAPYPDGDPGGVVPFFVVLALLVPSIIAGTAVGASRLAGTLARGAGLLGYSAAAAAVSWLICGWWLGTVDGGAYPVIVFGYALAVAAACAGLAAWALPLVVPAGVVFLGLGLPATGGPGALLWFVPEPFHALTPVLPPSAAVEALRATAYFHQPLTGGTYLTFAIWAVAGWAALTLQTNVARRRLQHDAVDDRRGSAHPPALDRGPVVGLAHEHTRAGDQPGER